MKFDVGSKRVGRIMAAVTTAALGAVLCAGVGTAMAAEAIDEQEPNDSFGTANAIKMNQTIYGVTDDRGLRGTDDYFKLVLPKNGEVIVSFQGDESYDPLSDSSRPSIAIEICGTNKKQIDGRTIYSDEKCTFNVALKRGTYYVHVPGGMYNSPYHFNLNYKVYHTNLNKLLPTKNGFNALWVKKSGAASYQIRYTPKSDYQSYDWFTAVTKTVSKKSSFAKITGLKSKTPYYVQVRVAKVIAGKTYYSAWTTKKIVTTK